MGDKLNEEEFDQDFDFEWESRWLLDEQLEMINGGTDSTETQMNGKESEVR